MLNLFDGELVNDKEWRTIKSKSPIFLIFDALVVSQANLIPLRFSQRLIAADGLVKSRYSPARHGGLRKPMEQDFSIDVYMKEMFNIWDAKHILSSNLMPKL